MSNINHVKVGKNSIGGDNPTYFIADIAANWDQSLSRAKDLIYLAAESGADAAKFQNFMADTIISAGSFGKMDSKLSHQASWKDSGCRLVNAARACSTNESIFRSEIGIFILLFFNLPAEYSFPDTRFISLNFGH